jgi:ABC-type amino acid transport system permease subunit
MENHALARISPPMLKTNKSGAMVGVIGNKTLHYSAAALCLALYMGLLVAAILSGALSFWALPLGLMAIYCADTLSGITHFFLDYRRTTPNSGLKELYFYQGNKGSQDYLQKRQIAMKKISPLETIVFDFKVHHLSPGALGRRSFLRVILPAMYFITLPSTSLLLLLHALGWIDGLVSFFLWVVIGALTLAQYAHSCAHRKQIPIVARYLQTLGVFMTKEQHNSHHLDLGVDFCILNGWANPIVNRIFRFCRQRGWIFEEGLEPI